MTEALGREVVARQGNEMKIIFRKCTETEDGQKRVE